MRVIFPKDNKLGYGQDFAFWTDVPDGVEFEVEDNGDYYDLTGKGYGIINKNDEYGNGAIALYKKQKFPFNIKDFEVGNKSKETNAQQFTVTIDIEHGTLTKKLVEAGEVLIDNAFEGEGRVSLKNIQALKKLVDEYRATNSK